MFDDIKVGDYVLYPVALKKNMFDRNPEYYWIRVKVEKVTPKRFSLKGDTYRKLDGKNIATSTGRWSFRYPEVKPFSEEGCQLSEYNAKVTLIKTQQVLRGRLDNLDTSKLNLDQLDMLQALLDNFER